MHSNNEKAVAWTAATRRMDPEDGGFDLESLCALRDRLRTLDALLHEHGASEDAGPLFLWRDPAGGEVVHFPLSEGYTLIGRHETCALSLKHKEISRLHCTLQVEGDFVRLEDAGSLNGTLVNGKRVDGDVHLRPGDAVTVGPVTLYFVMQTEAPDYQDSHETELKQ